MPHSAENGHGSGFGRLDSILEAGSDLATLAGTLEGSTIEDMSPTYSAVVLRDAEASVLRHTPETPQDLSHIPPPLFCNHVAEHRHIQVLYIMSCKGSIIW